ncbi:MAG: 30S ribosomal protein S2 [Candidatus Anoxychlamydiales bacterium]|uniref:30S ribosomal protein S2 n=1 Tax=marine sediment metagenome TaxID=412755 RepID=A0A0F9MI00_9ZZZZ|nr:30S ribosomal protein S2 [Candidatus Anoxychlamydiales bacterium]NGX40714.1 30S ribosomal protein S2 [Candidatus Anoxychlamydiales bacterium]HEU64365.1 30S ribosomal protein S2 [Chlamydiota bacterium]
MGKQKEELDITIKDLLQAGAHFGHQKMRWNPKMKRFIFEERSGIYIIDLAKTMQQIRNALEVVKDVVTQHKTIMFVGTKKQAKIIIRECAENADEFYVNERWLGGMLTNLTTIRKSIKTLEKVEKRIATGGEGLTKKELSNLTKEQQKLDKNLSGIRAMRKPPGLLIVVDPYQEHIAVAEAKKLNIPVMALVDTNCNPDPIDYVIACNDDALKSVKLILTTLTNAIIEKKKEMKVVKKGEKKPTLKTSIEEDIEVDVSDTETDKEV